ncbi:MAG: hypothetical protein ROZ09_15265 [Thiobacillus sp.]|uniref:hypothetical protein n=1 Tax=Thiobacillus sp. TaxID=924 RepID=UPI0028944DC5|nr:hypothetical protein [Thiobacillus sp.]MDT3708180.1 hypothetical protein [Thiobacillus sp.]
MTALPPSTDFTGASITEAQFKTAITALRDYLSAQFGTAGDVATALATLGALGSSTVAKTGAYTVVTTDRGKLITCSGTFTLSLTAAATLGDGFSFAVANTGTGTITIDPNSTELIDAAATVSLGAGETCVVTCTGGTAFRTVGKPTANGEFRSQQIFGSSGSYNKPAGLKRVKVTVVGGGGGSGGAYAPNYAAATSQAGGGAGASEKVIEASSLSASETVTVGGSGGGGSGTNPPTAGGSGGSSSFGAHCSATGGGGGLGALGPLEYTQSAAPGIGSGGNINYRGLKQDFSEGGSSLYGGCAINGAPAVYGAGGGSRISSNLGANGITGGGGVVIVEEFF